MAINKPFKTFFNWAILISPFMIWVLPNRFFDNGQTLCPSKRFLNIACPGCGITRAIERIIHGKFTEAWELNKFSFIVIIFFSIIWLHVLGLVIKKPIFTWLKKWY